jgi:hypothetical protein
MLKITNVLIFIKWPRPTLLVEARGLRPVFAHEAGDPLEFCEIARDDYHLLVAATWQKCRSLMFSEHVG